MRVRFLEGPHQSGFNAAHDKTICTFDLAVGLWVIDRGIVEPDAQISTPGFHLIGCEIGAVVGDDGVRNTITVHNTGYKVYHWPGFGHFNWFGLYPLGELIHHDQHIFFLMASSFKGSDHIESLDRKRPSDRDCL